MFETETKQKLVQAIEEKLLEKESLLKQEMRLSKEARDSDTKSSAGDKYETSRAMIQIEMDKLAQALDQVASQMAELGKVDFKSRHSKVGFGSLVLLDSGIFFVSISLGKVELEGQSFFVISPTSPLALAIWGKSSGAECIFQGKKVSLKNVV